LGCEIFGSIWLLVRQMLRIHSGTLIQLCVHVLFFGTLGDFSNKIRYYFYTIWLACAMVIRMERNFRCLWKKVESIDHMFDNV